MSAIRVITRWAAASFAACLMLTAPLHAEPTAVTVHVISEDGKFIGDSMGGAEVVLRDVQSGRILAQGVTRGGTGDTNRIMNSTGRSPLRASAEAANFSAVIHLAEPTLVRLEARAPLGHPGSLLRVSAERWLVPGQSLETGDGWTIEMPGLAVAMTAIPQPIRIGTPVSIEAQVQLMCGCPITRGGIWNSDDYIAEALVYRRGKLLQRIPLPFTVSPGRFGTAIQFAHRGLHKLVLSARNRRTGNSGVHIVRLGIEAAVTTPSR